MRAANAFMIAALLMAAATAHAQSLDLVAGGLGGFGNADGVGANARFSGPAGIAFDDAGNAYVADSGSHTIRKIVLATGTVTTFAGSPGNVGSADGVGTAARFWNPFGIAADGAGNLYVSELYNFTIRKIVIATTQVTTIAGSPGSFGSTDGIGAAARFNNPGGIALDSVGNLYVADYANHTIRKIVLSSALVTTVAGLPGSAGTADGVGSAARFNYPSDLTADATGNLYISDSSNHTIRRMALDTNTVTTLAGSPEAFGSTDGIGIAARFWYPRGLTVGQGENLYVVDQNNFTIRQIALATAEVTTFAGTPGMSGSADGPGAAARFLYPISSAADGLGNLYVGDGSNFTVRQIVLATAEVTTVAGLAAQPGAVDGVGDAARFYSPLDVATTGDGNLYVVDSGNHTIRKIVLATGQVTTFAGSPGVPGSADGIGASARFAGPQGIVADGAGNLYVADTYNNTIRQIIVATRSVTTLAGSPGAFGSTDGIGAEARFGSPGGVAVDGGNLYVVDTGNHTIRSITLATAEVTTLAGSAGFTGSADGIGSTARFHDPSGIATDGVGHVYIADLSNHTIRQIDVATAQVVTFAGFPGLRGSTDGIGGAARFNYPFKVAVDGTGRLYVTDSLNHTLRQVDLDSAGVSTFAGMPGVAGVQPGLLPTSLNNPRGIVVAPTGEVITTSGMENAVLQLH